MDIEGEKLVFRRKDDQPRPPEISKPDRRLSRHPGFGFMKGEIHIEPGFDLSAPWSDEVWDEGYLGVER